MLRWFDDNERSRTRHRRGPLHRQSRRAGDGAPLVAHRPLRHRATGSGLETRRLPAAGPQELPAHRVVARSRRAAAFLAERARNLRRLVGTTLRRDALVRRVLSRVAIRQSFEEIALYGLVFTDVALVGDALVLALGKMEGPIERRSGIGDPGRRIADIVDDEDDVATTLGDIDEDGVDQMRRRAAVCSLQYRDLAIARQAEDRRRQCLRGTLRRDPIDQPGKRLLSD